MVRDEDSLDRPIYLSEESAHRLLARAVELDSRHANDVSLAQLRDVANEAGIDGRAFEMALQELPTPTPHSLTEFEKGRGRPGLLARLWRRVAGTIEDRPIGVVASGFERVATNVLAFAAFWVVLFITNGMTRSGGAAWPVSHGVTILVNLLGLGLALRMRARATALVLAVSATMLVAEYPMHLMFGISTVQGGATKWALLLAGGLGIGFGILFARKSPRTIPPAPSRVADVASPNSSGTRDDENVEPSRSLRLHLT